MENKNVEFVLVVILSIVSVAGGFLIALTASLENSAFIVFVSFGMLFAVCVFIYFFPKIKELIFPSSDPKTNPSVYLLRGINGDIPRARKFSLESRIRKPKI